MRRSVRGRGSGGSTAFSGSGAAEEPAWLAGRLAGSADPAPVIVEAALAEKNELCVRTVRLFVSILGAEAGNLALKTLATGGVYSRGRDRDAASALSRRGDVSRRLPAERARWPICSSGCPCT